MSFNRREALTFSALTFSDSFLSSFVLYNQEHPQKKTGDFKFLQSFYEVPLVVC